MKIKLLIISAALLLFAGCSKDKLASGEMKLSKVYAGGQLQSEYSYNQSGALSSHKLYSFGRVSAEINCFYDGKRLIKRETAFDLSSGPNPLWSYGYTEYIYGSDGRVTDEINYSKQNNIFVLTSKVKPAYDGSGRITSRTMYTANDVAARLTKYEYGSGGNIIVQEEYQYNGTTAVLQLKYSYDDFDDKLNPYAGLGNAVLPFSVNRNNIIKTTVTNYVMTPGTPIITISNAVYNSYNSSGFPVKVFESGTEFVFEYK